MDRLRRLLPFVKPLLILALFALALRALQDTLSHYRYHDVVAYVSSLRADQIILAAVLTLAGYLIMTGYDALAFRYIRHPLPYRRIALASFIGYAFNNNVGLSGLVGGTLRYRLYNAWRLSAVEIAKVIAFYTITFWLGVFEAIILLFLAPYYHAGAILGSLIAFRGIYYLFPLIVATILLTIHEVLEKREGVARVARVFGRWAPGIAPQLLAFTTFIGGA